MSKKNDFTLTAIGRELLNSERIVKQVFEEKYKTQATQRAAIEAAMGSMARRREEVKAALRSGGVLRTSFHDEVRQARLNTNPAMPSVRKAKAEV